MTSIAVVYNKNGIAIASDSAATSILPNWNSKIFNANKIFRLTLNNQVWIWIYQNSVFWWLPRETIIKEYRKHNKKEFNLLQEYVNDFLSYLVSSNFIENTHIKDLFIHFLGKFQTGLDEYIQNKKFEEKKVITEADIPILVREFIVELKTLILSNKETNLNQISFNKKQIEHKNSKLILSITDKEEIKTLVEWWWDVLIAKYLADLLEIFEDYLNHKLNIRNYSWLIFFWFWKQEMIPKLFHIIIREKINNNTLLIDLYENHSEENVWVRWYADNKVIINSVRWFNPDLQGIIANEIRKIWQKNKIDYNELEQSVLQAFDSYRTKEVNSFFTATSLLSIDELWQEVETLVNMSSFKKRISSDMETVWWMTDVAVITKWDWFIWIKRKHYFDPKLNSHYFN